MTVSWKPWSEVRKLEMQIQINLQRTLIIVNISRDHLGNLKLQRVEMVIHWHAVF